MISHESPWAILVSEVMLQQTQTSRVEEPWRAFLTLFPTPTDCAAAPLSAILTAWRGLGYHRRAKALHETAKILRDRYDGAVPSDVVSLLQLPGIGSYTASAVASFAFGHNVAVLDTNVGRVLARALANRSLRPTEARQLAAELLPKDNVAAFNQAMLDLGAQFCRAAPLCAECPMRRQCAWLRDGGEDPAPFSAGVSKAQPAFQGSNRQLRGKVVEALRGKSRTLRQLRLLLEEADAPRFDAVLLGLESDGLITRTRQTYSLASS